MLHSRIELIGAKYRVRREQVDSCIGGACDCQRPEAPRAAVPVTASICAGAGSAGVQSARVWTARVRSGRVGSIRVLHNIVSTQGLWKPVRYRATVVACCSDSDG